VVLHPSQSIAQALSDVEHAHHPGRTHHGEVAEAVLDHGAQSVLGRRGCGYYLRVTRHDRIDGDRVGVATGCHHLPHDVCVGQDALHLPLTAHPLAHERGVRVGRLHALRRLGDRHAGL